MADETLPSPPVTYSQLKADVEDELRNKANRSAALAGNVLINSNFALNRRGSATYTAEGYTLDRWRLRPGGALSSTISQGSGITDDAEFALFWERDAAGGATDIMEQRIEDVRRFSGKRLAVSYDVISDAGVDITFALDTIQVFGSGGSADVSTADLVQIATTTAERKLHLIDIPSVAGKTIGANNRLGLRFFRGTGGTNGDMRIGNVDVRIIPNDTTPTSIEYVHPDPAIDEARAARYLKTFSAGLVGFAFDASRIDMGVTFEKMRDVPVLSLLDTSIIIERQDGTGATSVASAITFDRETPEGARITLTGFSGLTTGESVITDQTTPWLAVETEI